MTNQFVKWLFISVMLHIIKYHILKHTKWKLFFLLGISKAINSLEYIELKINKLNLQLEIEKSEGFLLTAFVNNHIIFLKIYLSLAKQALLLKEMDQCLSMKEKLLEPKNHPSKPFIMYNKSIDSTSSLFYFYVILHVFLLKLR